MAFMDAFTAVKAAMSDADASGISGHLAIQVNLTDENSSGICYIEINGGKLYVEPYDYVDRDALITVSSKDFIRIMNGRLGYDTAVANGTMLVIGDENAAAELKKLVKKQVRKPAVRKKTVKETDDKPKTGRCAKKDSSEKK